MSNSKYSNDGSEPKWIEANKILYKYGIECRGTVNDHDLAILIRMVIAQVKEQTRTNTIKAAVEALPEKWETPERREYETNRQTGYNDALREITRILKALIGGDDE